MVMSMHCPSGIVGVLFKLTSNSTSFNLHPCNTYSSASGNRGDGGGAHEVQDRAVHDTAFFDYVSRRARDDKLRAICRDEVLTFYHLRISMYSVLNVEQEPGMFY